MKLTQSELAEKAGVGLRFIRDLEQGKESLRLDKVNQVLQLFGHKVGAVPRSIHPDSSLQQARFNPMRQAAINIEDQLAGWLTQDDHGYHFVYEPAYAAQPGARPVSLTIPLQDAPHTSNVLFHFFDGLIPEGRLLEIAEKNWELNPRDRMGLLLACCKDCIGAVSVEAVNAEDTP